MGKEEKFRKKLKGMTNHQFYSQFAKLRIQGKISQSQYDKAYKIWQEEHGQEDIEVNPKSVKFYWDKD